MYFYTLSVFVDKNVHLKINLSEQLLIQYHQKKRTKYLGVNFIKDAENVTLQNITKEIKEDFPRHKLERLNIVKMALPTHSKNDLQIQCNCYPNSHWLICRNGKTNPQIHMESQAIPNTQNKPNKEMEEQTKSEALTVPDSKTYKKPQ